MADEPHPPERADPDAHTQAAPLQTDRLTSDAGLPLVAGRYEILGMLGAGGMGTVYRARDRELDEIVAIKLLRKELAAAEGMLERFRREVKLARRVTHRNVARTFDIGEHGGDRFLTMELVEGEMLGALLARRGRVSPREALRIGVDVCAGLAAAHAAGVLHRDLKPENVILSRDGRAMITDFGIARAVTESELGRTVGGIVGTPAYMAPEQVEGAIDLDGRTDLYALGVMLFELLSGEVPWSGDSVVAIAAARLLRPPPDVRTHDSAITEPVAELVLKLMARGRADRFATAEEAGSALAALQGDELPPAPSLVPAAPTPAAAGRAQRTLVAVLPLLNLAAEDDEYLAQTVTEDLVDLLSVVPELRVRPRGETTRFAARARDVREAGRELGVDVIVDGSLRRLGDLVRVSFRLVTVEDGFQLWARRFDGPPAQVLNVADEAASAIALALQTERAAAPQTPDTPPAAQELYLRGRFLLHRGWFEMAREGVRLLQEAHMLAPADPRIAGTYALAVARVKVNGPDYRAVSSAARELAERTIASHPKQPEALVALGFTHLNDAEGTAAATQLMRALAVAPNSVEALDAVGRILVETGQTDRGIAMLRRALAHDPNMAQATQALARTHALLGDDERASEVLGPVPREASDFVPYLLMKGRIALWRGTRSLPSDIMQAVARASFSPFARERLEGLLYVIGERSLTPQVMANLESHLPIDTRFSPRQSAFHAQIRIEVKLAAGAFETALTDLRHADANGLLDLLWLDRCPLFAVLRGSAELANIRESTAARVDRILRILTV